MRNIDSCDVSLAAQSGRASREANPWKHVVLDLLAYPSSIREAPPWVPAAPPARERKSAAGGASPSYTVIVEERLANTLIALSWIDPTCGSFRDQIWRLATARRAGICALSGRPVRKGDAIFRPRGRRRDAPRNWNAMILATSLAEPCDRTPTPAPARVGAASRTDTSRSKTKACRRGAA
ncbi:DUF3331 domain-containing protein [Trinickia caryophylli]|uniref:DUF3331 domain-containing protein n=1 Tax=Trinickia caryophylli TaxID=28094 RepID=A0A1X7EP76_TRICW|nr:DUF3331 domain-containing protein [Trinickia caryophylli]PMS10247.1 DUF3331 domain-containing protein [Trinickia caryophylli]TRX18717.1 DUF3331 domain-containing protein [Trinickia caryophylli]WQE10487.1 DUF3331 domain-containing protein [Trinickia caryophylli]SMF37469.1 protein of unknown function [Trinickia caryophylli]GLU32839.1 hypothetical protein Busp01_26810 [Trinickia caryophylli]